MYDNKHVKTLEIEVCGVVFLVVSRINTVDKSVDVKPNLRTPQFYFEGHSSNDMVGLVYTGCVALSGKLVFASKLIVIQ